MPDGRTHDAIAMVSASFAAPICLGIVFDGSPARATLAIGSYLVSGLLFSDDLDIHSIEYKRWRLLRFLWWPYQKLMPHRSWLSHGLIIGPALRILYFTAVCTFLFWLCLLGLSQALPLDAGGLVGGMLAAIARSIRDYPEGWALAFAAFVMGSVVHVASDALWTWWRRLWRGPAVGPAGAAAAGAMPTHHGRPVPDFM